MSRVQQCILANNFSGKMFTTDGSIAPNCAHRFAFWYSTSVKANAAAAAGETGVRLAALPTRQSSQSDHRRWPAMLGRLPIAIGVERCVRWRNIAPARRRGLHERSSKSQLAALGCARNVKVSLFQQMARKLGRWRAVEMEISRAARGRKWTVSHQRRR
jgi:hypothetical protein